jgi:hypothetical protein
VSFFRPKLPENRDVNPEASFRLRGLGGFPPRDVVAMNDAFWSGQDVRHWILSGGIAGAAGNLSKVGIYTPLDQTLAWIIDDYRVACSAADTVTVGSFLGQGTAVAILLTRDTNVWTRNRALPDTTGAPQRIGAFRIADNSVVGSGTELDRSLISAGLSTPWIPFGFVLFGNEAAFLANSVVNLTLHATMRGRVRRFS